MKACLFSAALICGAMTISAGLAAERGAAPATDGQAVAHPADHGDAHQTPSAGASGSVQAPPAAAGERPGADSQDQSVSKALKGDAEAPPAGPTHANGPPQPTGESRHDDNAKPSTPIDTHITVNQGRTLETNKKGPTPTAVAPVDKARRANAPKGVHVPHAVVRSGTVHGPTRNAVGVAPDANAGAPRMGGTPFPPLGAKSPESPVAGARSTPSPGVQPPFGAPAMGRMGSGTGAGAPSAGRPTVPGSASINGTGMARGPLRVGGIGGPAKNTGGINGSSVRAKRP